MSLRFTRSFLKVLPSQAWVLKPPYLYFSLESCVPVTEKAPIQKRWGLQPLWGANLHQASLPSLLIALYLPQFQASAVTPLLHLSKTPGQSNPEAPGSRSRLQPGVSETMILPSRGSFFHTLIYLLIKNCLQQITELNLLLLLSGI